MRRSIKTVVSLSINVIKILDHMVDQIRDKTSYKVNRSLIIRISILYLSDYEETSLLRLLKDYKSISKWQTHKESIKEITITLNQKSFHLLELLTKIDMDYKLYKSGLIRLAIIKLSEEKNLVEIFLNLINEV